MIDAHKHIMDYENIYEEYLHLLDKVYKVPKEDRTHILLTFAGNALHDLPTNIVRIFFKEYFNLKQQVNDVLRGDN